MATAPPPVDYAWRGAFSNEDVNALHAEAFETRVFSAEEWDWVALTERHSLGWVTARQDDQLVGFVNVPWDGFIHAWIQDTMVAMIARHQGVGVQLITRAATEAKAAGCEWLHVDFDDELEPFYIEACGFKPAKAGLIEL